MTRSCTMLLTAASLGMAIALAAATAAMAQKPMSQEGTGSTGGAQPMSQEGTGSTSGAQPMSQAGTGASQVSEAQTTQIRASLQTFSAEALQTAEADIVSAIDRAIQYDQAATPDQRALLRRKVRNTVDAWNSTHGPATTDRDGLTQLLVKIASAGVRVESVIIPSVQYVREAAMAAPPDTVVTADQKAQIKSTVETLTPQDVKQIALDIVTGIEQYIYGVSKSGTQEEKARLAARLHRAFVVWRKEHGNTPVRDDLNDLLVNAAKVGVAVQEGIIPSVQKVREAAARTPGAHPAAVITRHR